MIWRKTLKFRVVEKYDYIENVKNDIKTYIKDNDIDVNSEDFDEEVLCDDLWCEDSVTGNASGSYTFSSWEAEEYICHNLDLLKECFDELGYDKDRMFNAEYCDVSIRCYLLPTCIAEVVEELKHEENGKDKDYN